MTKDEMTLMSPFVVDSLDRLMGGPRCCVHECAMCFSIMALWVRGMINDVVAPYARHNEHEWWIPAEQRVNWKIVTSHWCDIGRCEAVTDDGEDLPSRQEGLSGHA